MILLVRDPGHRIDEGHCRVIIFEMKLTVDRRMTRRHCPLRYFLEVVMHLRFRQVWSTFDRRFTMLITQTRHALGLLLEFVIGLVEVGDDVGDLVFRPGHTQAGLAPMHLCIQGFE
jgi:hypothetical protein